MAMKKDMTKEQLRAKKNNDAAVYKVMIALVLLCGALLGLRSLRSYYTTTEGFTALYDRTPAILIAGLVIAVLAPLLVFSFDNFEPSTVEDLPVTLTQLTGETGTQREIMQEDSSFLCSYGRYWDTGENDVRITYTIVDVKCPLFYDMLLNEQEQQFMQSSMYSYLPIGEELRDQFDAEYVRHSRNNTGDRWLICWDSRIVNLRASWELTGEQIDIIVDQLMPK